MCPHRDSIFTEVTTQLSCTVANGEFSSILHVSAGPAAVISMMKTFGNTNKHTVKQHPTLAVAMCRHRKNNSQIITFSQFMCTVQPAYYTGSLYIKQHYYLRQAMSRREQCTEGTQRFEDPVSKRTWNLCPGVPMVMFP